MLDKNPDCPFCDEDWDHQLWTLQQYHVHSQMYKDYCVGRYIRCHRGYVRCPIGNMVRTTLPEIEYVYEV